jgi:hypothetical protein
MLIVAGTLLLAVPPALALGAFLSLQHSDLGGGLVVHYALPKILLWLVSGLASLIWGIRLVLKS